MSDTPTQFWTPLLRPGRYRLSTGRVVEYTRRDCRNAVEQGNRMRSAGLRAPVCWMHDPNATPAYLSATPAPGAPDAWLAKGYIGEPVKFRVGPDGGAEGLVRFHDPKDAEQFKRVGGVSPRVDFDWTDERGKTWPGCTISHVAVTPRPIQRDLAQPRPAYPPHYLSHATPGRSRETHYLAHATRVEGADMADKPDDETPPESETPEAEAPPEPPPEPEAPSGDTGALQKIIDSLVRMGIKVGDATDLDDLASRLDAIAEHTGGGPKPDPNAGLDEQPDGGDGTQPAPMPPALMSHFTAAARLKGETLEGEIRGLFRTGRIDGAVRDKLIAELKRANLSHQSFTRDGSLKPFGLLDKIAAYKDLPPGKFTPKPKPGRGGDLSHAADVDPPELLRGGIQDDIQAADAEAKAAAARLSVGR